MAIVGSDSCKVSDHVELVREDLETSQVAERTACCGLISDDAVVVARGFPCVDGEEVIIRVVVVDQIRCFQGRTTNLATVLSATRSATVLETGVTRKNRVLALGSTTTFAGFESTVRTGISTGISCGVVVLVKLRQSSQARRRR